MKTFGDGNYLGDNQRAARVTESRRALPEHLRVMPATTQHLPSQHLTVADPADNPLTEEHVVWKQQIDRNVTHVGFDNGEVWAGRKVLNPATERRDAVEWTLVGHWHADDDEPQPEG